LRQWAGIADGMRIGTATFAWDESDSFPGMDTVVWSAGADGAIRGPSGSNGERVVVGNVAEEKRGRRPSSSGGRGGGEAGHVGFGSMFDGETGNGFSLN
jgi:hypothetical protein